VSVVALTAFELAYFPDLVSSEDDVDASLLSGGVEGEADSPVPRNEASTVDTPIVEQLWHLLSMHEVQSAPGVSALKGLMQFEKPQATCSALQLAQSSA
jgi:hypothetical protein